MGKESKSGKPDLDNNQPVKLVHTMETGTRLYFVLLTFLRNVIGHHVTITSSNIQSIVTHIISYLKHKESRPFDSQYTLILYLS